MATKTVKLNATLHEELKSIAEKDGFVLQDLIEEKLTELLEEKGIYNFDPSRVEFTDDEQLFTMKLTPSNFQALIVMIKRLCLNEKISNINQMNNLIDAVKTMESIFESSKNKMTAVNDFFSGSQNTIMNVIKAAVINVEKEEYSFKTPKAEVALPMEDFLFEKMEKESIERRHKNIIETLKKKETEDKSKNEYFKIAFLDFDIMNAKYVLSLQPNTELSKTVTFMFHNEGHAFFKGCLIDLFELLPTKVTIKAKIL
jgi:hypothetical protein